MSPVIAAVQQSSATAFSEMFGNSLEQTGYIESKLINWISFTFPATYWWTGSTRHFLIWRHLRRRAESVRPSILPANFYHSAPRPEILQIIIDVFFHYYINIMNNNYFLSLGSVYVSNHAVLIAQVNINFVKNPTCHQTFLALFPLKLIKPWKWIIKEYQDNRQYCFPRRKKQRVTWKIPQFIGFLKALMTWT